MIDISQADKAEVLLRLYNHGHNEAALRELYRSNPKVAEKAIELKQQLAKMTREQAEKLVRHGELYFDYMGSKKFPVDLRGATFDESLYDRDNGKGAARRALEGLEGVRFSE